MSHRIRVVVGVVAGMLWGAWATLHLTNPGDEDAIVFPLEALRAAATLLTSAWAVGAIVTPLIQSAVVWREVGRREGREERCTCRDNIIPIRYVRDLEQRRDSLRP